MLARSLDAERTHPFWWVRSWQGGTRGHPVQLVCPPRLCSSHHVQDSSSDVLLSSSPSVPGCHDAVFPFSFTLLSRAIPRALPRALSDTFGILVERSLGVNPIFCVGVSVRGGEAPSEDTVPSRLQSTLRWGCLVLHRPGVIFRAVPALTTPILGMGKLMFSPTY